MDYNIYTNRAILQEGPCQLTVDTTLLGGLEFQPGQLYQFVGELEQSEDGVSSSLRLTSLITFRDQTPLLRARVMRDIDGMDMDLYRRAVELMRQTLHLK